MKNISSKKGQIINWLWAMMVIFAIIIGWWLLLKPWQAIDNAVSPLVTIDAGTNNGQDVISTIRKYWYSFPLVLIGSTLIWAFFSSLRQDPNYPQQ